MSLKDLKACQNYYEMVQAAEASPPMCRACQAILLYYLDDRDNIYFKCLSCDRITYPGSPFFEAMEEDYNEWKEQNG